MLNNILTIGFPIYLIFFELLLRTIASVDASAFIGPTLAAAGLSVLISLAESTKGNSGIELSYELKEQLKSANVEVVKKSHKLYEKLIWGCILLGLLVWYWSCNVAITNPNSKTWIVPNHFLIGGINYIISVVLISRKK